MLALRKLWNGDLPLETAFWNYAVFGGIVINLVTSAAFLILIAHDLPLAAGSSGMAFRFPITLLSRWVCGVPPPVTIPTQKRPDFIPPSRWSAC